MSHQAVRAAKRHEFGTFIALACGCRIVGHKVPPKRYSDMVVLLHLAQGRNKHAIHSVADSARCQLDRSHRTATSDAGAFSILRPRIKDGIASAVVNDSTDAST